jgi:hypothetical protein
VLKPLSKIIPNDKDHTCLFMCNLLYHYVLCFHSIERVGDDMPKHLHLIIQQHNGIILR